MTPDRSDPESNTGVSRRKFVAGAAAGWTSVVLAGCNALSPSEETDTEGPTETGTATETETPEPQAENYVVTDDIMAGSGGSAPAGAGGFADACSWTRTFTHGMEPVFKVGVYDSSGEQLGSDEISVAINIDGGPTADLAWGGDAEENPAQEWSGPVWEQIPEDWPTGETTYTVEISDSDANFTDIGIASGMFEVVDYNDPANNYVATVEPFRTSAHGTENPGGFVQSCAPANTFAPGAEVGFDVGIWNGSSGEMVGANDEIVDSITISFDTGQEIDLSWATNDDGEPIPTDEWALGEHAWYAIWTVPDDTTENVSYEVQISGTDGDAEFNQVGIYRNSVRIADV